ncbi:MAG: hypothetical protein FKY71_08920 [Spiribacter salinus]|uniref:Uncharacterized protein n=1 Tax=Spiribacter salinus TaxID=1335746 RepID=A0A540VRK8_9GAMM|nr:MAG: hypothetical protein FKY71_08920 [Spiribacter salinus]
MTPERSLKRMAKNAGIETHLPKSKLIDRLVGLLDVEPEEAASVELDDGGEGGEAVSEEAGELLDFEAFDNLKLSEKKEALKDLGLLDEVDDLRSGDSMSLVYADYLEGQ